MYKKGSKGWLKHFDFILLDMICLQIAFLLAYVIRHDSGSPYIVPLYRNMAIFMELLDIIVMFFYETLSNVLKRGYFREFAVTVKHVRYGKLAPESNQKRGCRSCRIRSE